MVTPYPLVFFSSSTRSIGREKEERKRRCLQVQSAGVQSAGVQSAGVQSSECGGSKF